MLNQLTCKQKPKNQKNRSKSPTFPWCSSRWRLLQPKWTESSQWYGAHPSPIPHQISLKFWTWLDMWSFPPSSKGLSHWNMSASDLRKCMHVTTTQNFLLTVREFLQKMQLHFDLSGTAVTLIKIQVYETDTRAVHLVTSAGQQKKEAVVQFTTMFTFL